MESNSVQEYAVAQLTSPCKEDIAARFEELVRLMTPIKDIATLLDVPEGQLRLMLGTPGHPLRDTYRRVKAEVQLESRQQILRLAHGGEPNAMMAAYRLLKEMEADE